MRAAAPTVSVVIPTHNRPAYLRRAIGSVNAQTYDDIELVVVDDCSEPPARPALEELPLTSIAAVNYIRHETNQGANAARNTGIEAATGEFIAFLDDDDWWERTKIARQVERFRTAEERVGVVYTGTRYVDRRDNQELISIPDLEGDVTRDILVGGQLQEFSAVMVRAAVIAEAGLPDPNLPSWQDREWYLRLSQHCTFRVVPEPLTVRQMGHGGQIRDNFEEKRSVSYPLLLERYRPLAASYGPQCERKFVGSLTRKLGQAAFKNGYYRDAFRYLARSLRYDPLAMDAYPYLLASIGGKHTHRLGRRIAGMARSIRG